MAMMRFGVAVTGGDQLAGESAVRSVIERARRLDRGGVADSVWVADERFWRDPWVQLGALAATTERVGLGTSVTDAFIRHPALTASAIATLDEASGGRAILGLGAGVSGFAAMGIERKAPATALRDMVTLARVLWTADGPVTYEGRTVTFRGDRLLYPVARLVPITIAGRGPQILELAGEVADTAMIGTFVGGALLDYALARVAAGDARRDPALPALRRSSWAYVSVDDDAAAARHAVREGIATALWGSRPILDTIGVELPRGLRELMDARPYSSDPAVLGPVAEAVPEALIADCSIAGTPAECAAAIRRLADRGIEEVVAWIFPTRSVGYDAMIDRFTSEVVPQVLRERPTGGA